MNGFSTARFALRLLEPQDEALYCRLYTDSDVMAHIAPPVEARIARRGFASCCRLNADVPWGQRRWVIVHRGTGTSIGMLALTRDSTDPGSAEIGVMLVPEVHGRGFANEIVEALVSAMFSLEEEGLQRVWARHSQGHRAAARLLASLGFQPGAPSGADATWFATRKTRRPARRYRLRRLRGASDPGPAELPVEQ